MSQSQTMGAAAPGEPTVNRALVTVSVMLATIMQAVDTTIANVALPHMQGSLSATQDQVAWVLTSYIVAAAIMTPTTGWLAGRFGRKRFFVMCVTGFTVSSVLCGVAGSLSQMVFYRLAQGVFGAALVPMSQAVLLDTFPREKHGSAMAMWGIGVMVGPILGPTLGGYLTEVYNWRWVFFINVPVGILAAFGLLAFVPETVRDRARRFDWLGFAFLSIAIGCLQLMLDRGETLAWFDSPEIIIETVLAVLGLYLFLVHVLTADKPFIDPKMFKDRNFVVGLFFIFVVGIILLATLALLPPFLQNLVGYPVITTGFVLAPRGVGTMTAMFLVGRLINRVDTRWLITAGLLLTSASLHQMAGFTPEVSEATIVYTGLLQGLGLGFIFVPLSTVTFATLQPHFRNEGTAMFSLMRNIGSSIGISLVMTLLARNTQRFHAYLGEHINLYNSLLMDWGSRIWHPGTAAGLAALNGEVTRQAATLGYMNDFVLMMWVTLAATPLVLLMRGASRVPREEDEELALLAE